MSSHKIESGKKGETLTVGWDRPMRTFFAQVERDWQNISDEVRNAIYEATAGDTSRDSYGKQVEEAEERLNADRIVLWLGGDFDEFPDFTLFVEALNAKGYAIPEDIQAALINDKMDDPPNSGGLASLFAEMFKEKN